MAWTERYVRSDAAGGGDGTTNTNSGANGAWTLAEGITNEAAGMRLNVLAGTYTNTTTSRALAAIGTTTAPIWWRGFKTTAGDQDSNNVAVTGTDIPTITFTTGQFIVTGAHHVFSNLDVTGASVTSGGTWFVNSAAACKIYRCRGTCTSANANGRGLAFNSAGGSVTASYFTASSSAACVSIGAATNIVGCVFNGGLNGIICAGGTGAVGLHFCVSYNAAGDAISSTSHTGVISGCSIYNPTGNGINITTIQANGLALLNNYFENVNQASKAAINNTSGTNTNLIIPIANAYYNCTANTNGLGDSPLIFDVGTLASAGFVAPGSQNFALNSVAKAIGFPGLFENTSVYQGYLDPGAVQRQEPAAGGIGSLIGGGLVL